MPSLQLLQLTDRGRGLLASRRSVGRLGPLTHSPTSLFSLSLAVLANCVPHRRHLCATNQEDARRCLWRRACRWSSGVRPLEPEPEDESGALAANGDGAGGGLAAARQKRSGLKSLHFLAAILLKKIGPSGTRYLLGLVLTAVGSAIFL
jgi:hypothetical protein